MLELLSNAGRLVTREELQQKLWPDETFVDFDVGVNTAIRKLRQALGDEADNPRFIETLSRRGYRFVAPITDTASAPLSTSQESPSDSPLTDSTTTISRDTRADSGSSSVPKPRRWYWVLAAACALALVIYGAVVA